MKMGKKEKTEETKKRKRANVFFRILDFIIDIFISSIFIIAVIALFNNCTGLHRQQENKERERVIQEVYSAMEAYKENNKMNVRSDIYDLCRNFVDSGSYDNMNIKKGIWFEYSVAEVENTIEKKVIIERGVRREEKRRIVKYVIDYDTPQNDTISKMYLKNENKPYSWVIFK
jgi:hypothetical protein